MRVLAEITSLSVVLAAVACGASGGGQSSPGAETVSIQRPAGSPSTECVDATGENSTPQEIVDARINFAVFDAYTGELSTDLDILRQGTEFSRYRVDGATTPDELSRIRLDELYVDVAAGGDAAFAEGACKLSAAWGSLVPRAELYAPTDGETKSRIASTPHVLRGLGREICHSKEINLDPDLELADKTAEEARSDPDKFKESSITRFDEMYAGVHLPNPADEQKFQESRLKRREILVSTPPDQFVLMVEQSNALHRLAFDKLCPQL